MNIPLAAEDGSAGDPVCAHCNNTGWMAPGVRCHDRCPTDDELSTDRDQAGLDRHNAEFDAWEKMTDAERERRIKWEIR